MSTAKLAFLAAALLVLNTAPASAQDAFPALRCVRDAELGAGEHPVLDAATFYFESGAAPLSKLRHGAELAGFVKLEWNPAEPLPSYIRSKTVVAVRYEVQNEERSLRERLTQPASRRLTANGDAEGADPVSDYLLLSFTFGIDFKQDGLRPVGRFSLDGAEMPKESYRGSGFFHVLPTLRCAPVRSTGA